MRRHPCSKDDIVLYKRNTDKYHPIIYTNKITSEDAGKKREKKKIEMMKSETEINDEQKKKTGEYEFE